MASHRPPLVFALASMIYALASIALVAVTSPAIYASFSPSPRGDYFLVRERVKPYSYLVRDRRFPEKISVIAVDGELVRELPDQSLQEAIPIGGVPVGPRGFQWMAGEDLLQPPIPGPGRLT